MHAPASDDAAQDGQLRVPHLVLEPPAPGRDRQQLPATRGSADRADQQHARQHAGQFRRQRREPQPVLQHHHRRQPEQRAADRADCRR